MVLPDEEYDRVKALRAARRRRPDVAELPVAYVVRDATPADMPSVRAIYNHYVTNSTVTFDEKPVTLQQQRAKLERCRRGGYPFLVAESSTGEILGYAFVAPYRDKSAYRFTVENSIYLGPAATGKGIGSALMTRLIEDAEAAGVKEIIAVIADQGADGSIALHERFGFRRIGEMGRVGYKFDRWLGTVILQRSLKPRRRKAEDTRP